MESYDSVMKEYHDELKRIAKEEWDEKRLLKKELKGLINVTGLYRFMNEDHDSWMPEGFVTVVLTDEKINGRGDTQCARIDGDVFYLYIKNLSSDVRGVDHYYVWQRTTNMDGDSYAGFLLWPLKNGKYLKVSYTC